MREHSVKLKWSNPRRKIQYNLLPAVSLLEFDMRLAWRFLPCKSCARSCGDPIISGDTTVCALLLSLFLFPELNLAMNPPNPDTHFTLNSRWKIYFLFLRFIFLVQHWILKSSLFTWVSWEKNLAWMELPAQPPARWARSCYVSAYCLRPQGNKLHTSSGLLTRSSLPLTCWRRSPPLPSQPVFTNMHRWGVLFTELPAAHLENLSKTWPLLY